MVLRFRVSGMVAVGALILDIVKAAKILLCISRLERQGRPPSLREVAERCKISYHTVEKYLPILRDKKMIEVARDGKALRVRVTKEGYDFIFAVSKALAMLGVSIEEV